MAAVIDMVRFCWIFGSHRTPRLFIARQQRLTKINICRWAFCVWCVVWEPHARWIVLSEKMFFFLFLKKKKMNIWSTTPSLPGLNQNKSVRQGNHSTPPKKKSHINISNNFQTSQVIVSLLILFVSFLYLSKKYILALSLKSSLLLFCRQQLHVVSYISFLINNIIPNWWPHHLSLAWDEKKAIIDSWL